MTEQDRIPFFELIGNVYAFYRVDFSAFVGGVWWMALKNYDLRAVEDGLGRHCANPDKGTFLPKPADVVTMLEGSTSDAAFMAWSAVDRAVRMVGPYRSVVFDDALTQCVIHEMGGWILLTEKDDKEWPFVRNEFVTRYRGYRARSDIPAYPATLIGRAQAQNSQIGLAAPPPLLLGNPEKAAKVMRQGAEKILLTVTSAAAFLPDATKRLANRVAA